MNNAPENKKPLFIFDLDGTLADIRHRRHFVERPRGEQNWKEFFKACAEDQPVHSVIAIMDHMRIFADVWIFSGRSDEVRPETEKWLAEHTSFMSHDVSGPILTMRKEGDDTPDDELKRSWYEGMLKEDQRRLMGVFDDRDRVVKMWRSLGIQCFQVADGDF